VAGDEYMVSVERDGVRERFTGQLVKANDQWIVLHWISEARTEFGVPVLSKVPYVNRLFTNVGIGREDANLWIPRDAAVIEQRTMSVKARPIAAIAEDNPPSGQRCDVQFALNGGSSWEHGRYAVTTERYTTMVVQQFVEPRAVGIKTLVSRATPEPRRQELDYVHKMIPRDSLFCVKVPNRAPTFERPGENQPVPPPTVR
jgi:hypothetical protein